MMHEIELTHIELELSKKYEFKSFSYILEESKKSIASLEHNKGKLDNKEVVWILKDRGICLSKGGYNSKKNRQHTNK